MVELFPLQVPGNYNQNGNWRLEASAIANGRRAVSMSGHADLSSWHATLRVLHSAFTSFVLLCPRYLLLFPILPTHPHHLMSLLQFFCFLYNPNLQRRPFHCITPQPWSQSSASCSAVCRFLRRHCRLPFVLSRFLVLILVTAILAESVQWVADERVQSRLLLLSSRLCTVIFGTL